MFYKGSAHGQHSHREAMAVTEVQDLLHLGSYFSIKAQMVLLSLLRALKTDFFEVSL